jgi:hypothetical protein
MAHFDFIRYVIDLRENRAFTNVRRAALADMPERADLTIAFVHEYTHYLQSVLSVYGIRLLSELVSLSVYVALPANGDGRGGVERPEGAELPSLVEAINALDDDRLRDVLRAGSGQAERVLSLVDEVDALFNGTLRYELGPEDVVETWTLDRGRIRRGAYNEAFVGILTPDGVFFAITPGLLIENMARRIDRWFAANVYTDDPPYEEHEIERGYYNGLFHLITSDARLRLPEGIEAEEITVLLCQLALGSSRPDHAIEVMLEALRQEADPADPAETLHTLVEWLVAALRANNFEGRPLWTASAYQEPVNLFARSGILDGLAEGPIIRHHLEKVARLVVDVQRNPGLFVRPDLDWTAVKSWLEAYGISEVQMADGPAEEVTAGIHTDVEFSQVMASVGRLYTRLHEAARAGLT